MLYNSLSGSPTRSLMAFCHCLNAYMFSTGLSPVHTSDADEPPTVGGTHFDAYEYLTGSYSGVSRRRFVAQEYSARRRQYLPSSIQLNSSVEPPTVADDNPITSQHPRSH